MRWFIREPMDSCIAGSITTRSAIKSYLRFKLLTNIKGRIAFKKKNLEQNFLRYKFWYPKLIVQNEYKKNNSVDSE